MHLHTYIHGNVQLNAFTYLHAKIRAHIVHLYVHFYVCMYVSAIAAIKSNLIKTQALSKSYVHKHPYKLCLHAHTYIHIYVCLHISWCAILRVANWGIPTKITNCTKNKYFVNKSITKKANSYTHIHMYIHTYYKLYIRAQVSVSMLYVLK